MNGNEDTRRPEQIEDDIERKRAEVSSTIDAIQSKLTPGQMMDQAIQYLRNSGTGEFGSNLGRTVRDNPVPVALIGVGIAWLAMGGGPRRRTDLSDWDEPPVLRTRTTYTTDEAEIATDWSTDVDGDLDEPGLASRISAAGSSAGSRVRDTVSGTASRVGGTVSSAASRVGETVSSAAGRVGDTVSSASERARDLAHGATQRLSGLREGVRTRTGELRGRTRAQVDRARMRADRMIDEQPLVLGAIGVAIGAAIGAALPSTRREDALLGETRDGLLEGAKQAAREPMRSVAESAQRVAHTAREEIERAIEPSTGGTPGPSGPSSSTDPTRPAAPH